MTDAAHRDEPSAPAAKKPARRAAKLRPSGLEALTPEELHTLRLDEDARAEFDIFAQRFSVCRAALKQFDGEDVGSMDDARYEQRAAAESEHHSSGMAVVHFLAPRILRLREGEAKRKWRSFLTRFRKDERLD